VFSLVTAPRQHDVDLNLAYTVSELPDMRCVPNMFTGSTSDTTHTLFDEMPGAHKVFSKIPGAHMMFTKEEGTTYMNDLIGGGVAGVEGEDFQANDDEIEETIEVVGTDTGKTLSKRKPRGSTAGTHHSKWKSLEDEYLIGSWKVVSLDPITGANQTLDRYYARIRDEFNERQHW
jgi:hypothetical protein